MDSDLRRRRSRADPPLLFVEGRRSRRTRHHRRRIAWVEFYQTYEQGFRIEDVSLERYELFVGEGEEPDFLASGQPVATSLTLPFEWTPDLPSSGDVTYYVVVRKRNAYNLESFNVWSTRLRFVAGVPSLGPISAPRDVAVYDRDSGAIQVIAKYLGVDEPDPADTWEIYVGEGVDPVPGVDTPDYSGDMAFIGVESVVSQVVSTFTPGSIVHVIVSAVRSADGLRNSAAVVLHTMAESLDLTDGFAFGGHTYEQQGPE